MFRVEENVVTVEVQMMSGKSDFVFVSDWKIVETTKKGRPMVYATRAEAEKQVERLRVNEAAKAHAVLHHMVRMGLKVYKYINATVTVLEGGE